MFLILLLICMSNRALSQENVLCTKDFCKDVTCSALSEKCTAQNATHNGVVLPSPETCNCCPYCIDNLAEGEVCSAGEFTDPVPKEVCGPGLYCKPTVEGIADGTCEKMNTPCFKLQNECDKRKLNGTLGTMEVRQDCNDEGEFVPYKCIPGQTCYCVNTEGERVFGEIDYTPIPNIELHCRCSLDYLTAVSLIGRELNPIEHFRCASNGDYSNLQCIGNKCLCVDSYDGAPTYPDDASVNLTDISQDTLKCYKNKEKGVFYTKCEQEYIEILNEYNKFKDQGFNIILGYEFPKCDLDGSYSAVQENSTHKYCVDPEGEVLVAVDKELNADSANSMDCKCVRASLIMSSKEKPQCSENGNYKPTQCRRGRCRCVDSNGNQICNKKNCEIDEGHEKTLKCK